MNREMVVSLSILVQSLRCDVRWGSCGISFAMGAEGTPGLSRIGEAVRGWNFWPGLSQLRTPVWHVTDITSLRMKITLGWSCFLVCSLFQGHDL